MSKIEVDKVIPQSGTTLTIGDSGDTIWKKLTTRYFNRK